VLHGFCFCVWSCFGLFGLCFETTSLFALFVLCFQQAALFVLVLCTSLLVCENHEFVLCFVLLYISCFRFVLQSDRKCQ
jgi:hypothetical protein